MPLVFEKTYDQLQAEVMSELTSSTNITRVTPGSKARTLSQVFNRKINGAYQDFDINFLRSFLPFAQGRFLEYLGDMLGIQRLGATRSTSVQTAQQVKFYVDSGTFGDLNSGNDIFIPAGVQISTLPNNEGIIYRVAAGVLLPASATEQYISVEAVQDGTVANLGPDNLTFTTFNNYTSGTGLKVNNIDLLTTGRDVESDNNYRFRINNQVLSSEKANETSVRLALLVVPGVSNIVVRPFARGIGTFDFLIQTVIPNTPEPVISACQQAINAVQAYGTNGRALRPRLTGMSFQVTITWRGDASTSERSQIKANIASALQDYVNNLAIGEDFIYNEAIQRIMQVDNKIKNIGTAARAIDVVSIYRESKLRDNKLKEELLTDYTPSADERLIIEESLTSPIILIDRN